MQNSDVEVKDKKLKNENIITQKDIQTAEDETLKVRLNKEHILVVNKK